MAQASIATVIRKLSRQMSAISVRKNSQKTFRVFGPFFTAYLIGEFFARRPLPCRTGEAMFGVGWT
jgi:hypothetical protein